MSQELTGGSSADNYVLASATTTAVEDPANDWRHRVGSAVSRLESVVPLRWWLFGVAVLGLVAAGGVGYLTDVNPRATPRDLAALGWILIIVVLIAAGVYAQTSRIRRAWAACLSPPACTRVSGC